ncbi:adenosine deaminase family protein [Streptomyces prasinopilosus]|uniref:Adenosine deaminase n=1 Tax=Streptomyces prasinopilosus TaxID=67344 RepID=A0A1G6RXG1_9ACTN|nr:hypothetical protein [Streptomyces prasinopilosus]SDD08635.1 adenosine deaminase [Streptomyces prasinopilosus]
MRDLRLLPKAHLHTHLESTVRGATIREPGGEPTVRDRPFTGFRESAYRRSTVRALLRDHRHFRRIAEEFCQDEAARGVRCAEVTFTAAAHGERLGRPEMPLEAVLEGLAAGAERYGIRTRVILDHSRRRSVERLWRGLEPATRYPQVIALGLAGDESCPAAPFSEALRAAREAGLHLVHPAGEAAGPASVWEALAVGHAERIGHGIRVLEDPDPVAELGRPSCRTAAGHRGGRSPRRSVGVRPEDRAWPARASGPGQWTGTASSRSRSVPVGLSGRRGIHPATTRGDGAASPRVGGPPGGKGWFRQRNDSWGLRPSDRVRAKLGSA